MAARPAFSERADNGVSIRPYFGIRFARRTAGNVHEVSLPRHALFRFAIPGAGFRRGGAAAAAARTIMLAVACAGCGAASAHPHVWVTASTELIYAPDGALTAVRHAWTFDDMFSSYALQGIETKTKGVYTRGELAPLAQTNVESLKEFGFFTFARAGDDTASRKKQKFEQPVDYFLEQNNGVLTLHFTLPLKAPVKSRVLSVDIYDPTFFIDFSLVKTDPVHLIGAPAACKLAIARPSDGAAQAQTLGEQNFLDGGNVNFGANFANKITVECP
jgi:ABC-type uncharacterized transport system substrate-binding protein